ncbi:family 16 glycoside hydrolase [Novipirellula sp. SH528]|uniref:family 16 glycoside hydrolase n=1 Tax=Novipirellula sp. SH528 TaxID=3454466 RepID=UPI003F9F3F8D
MHRSACLGCSLALVLSSTVWAEKNAQISPKIAPLKSPTATLTFDEPLSKVMRPAKGEWSVVGGVLMGKELAADKHAAVMNYQVKNRDSVIRFSFKFDGQTKGFHFSLNHAKGHLFRISVTPKGMSLNLDKDKLDPQSKAVALGTAKAKFETGKWYTMQVEMKGDRVVVQADNGTSIDVTNNKLDTDKPNYRFVMRGDSLAIDDIHVWSQD